MTGAAQDFVDRGMDELVIEHGAIEQQTDPDAKESPLLKRDHPARDAAGRTGRFWPCFWRLLFYRRSQFRV
jgi:hypothetical protein